MDSEVLRLGAGIIGGLLALLMFASPVNTFRTVMRKKSTQEFSGLPYAVALLNCLIYIWYGSPFVSGGWGNLIVFVVNAIGLVLNLGFVTIYLLYAPSASKACMQGLLAAVITLFVALLLASIFAVDSIKQRRLVVGTVGMIASISLNASPLLAMVRVVRTKSVEFVPISFSVFSTVCCCFWLAYGALSRDLNIMGPNFVSISLGVVQILMYLIYRNKGKALKEEGAPEGCIEERSETDIVATEESHPNRETAEEKGTRGKGSINSHHHVEIRVRSASQEDIPGDAET